MEEAKGATKSTPETYDGGLESTVSNGVEGENEGRNLGRGRTARAQGRLHRQGPGPGAPLREKLLNPSHASAAHRSQATVSKTSAVRDPCSTP